MTDDQRRSGGDRRHENREGGAVGAGSDVAAGGSPPTGSTGWDLLKVAVFGFFGTRLVLLPARLVARWMEREAIDPSWVPTLVRQAHLWIPAAVAVILVLAELQQRDQEPGRESSIHPRAAWAVWALFLGAPLPAEYLASYLPETGDAVAQLAGLLWFAPLYGGTALLIREVAVRTGRGWPARLAWAAAFGVVMPCLVDLSAFTPHQPDIVFWDELWAPTALPALGTSAYPLVSFVLGHVVLSIGAPLAVFDGVFPSLRRRPLLSRRTIVALVVAWILVVSLIRAVSVVPPNTPPSMAQTVIAGLVVAVLLVAGRILPRPVEPGRSAASIRQGGALPGTPGLPGSPVLFVGAAAAQIGIDLLPATWAGLGVLVAIAVIGAQLIWHWARGPEWSPGQVATLAVGAIVGRAIIGFMAPVPLGVDPTSKYVQNLVLLVPVLAVTWLVLRRARTGDRPPAGSRAPT